MVDVVGAVHDDFLFQEGLYAAEHVAVALSRSVRVAQVQLGRYSFVM
jgi:hypothetical protein